MAFHFNLHHPDDVFGQVSQLLGCGCLAIDQAQAASLRGGTVHHALDLASQVLLAREQACASLGYQLLLHQVGLVAGITQALLRGVRVHAQLLGQVIRAHGGATGLEHGVAFHQELGGGVAVGNKVAVGVARACWMIDGFYVASAFRDGWATLWLRYELVQTGLRLGRTPQYRVRARNDQTNTVAFARRLGALALAPRYLMAAP